MKAWRAVGVSKIVEPVRPEKSCGVCVVDEAGGLTMETAEEEKEKS